MTVNELLQQLQNLADEDCGDYTVVYDAVNICAEIDDTSVTHYLKQVELLTY